MHGREPQKRGVSGGEGSQERPWDSWKERYTFYVLCRVRGASPGPRQFTLGSEKLKWVPDSGTLIRVGISRDSYGSRDSYVGFILMILKPYVYVPYRYFFFFVHTWFFRYTYKQHTILLSFPFSIFDVQHDYIHIHLIGRTLKNGSS
jgi:hypothetical protein